MGKRLRQQRRGKPQSSFRKPSHRFKVDVKFRSIGKNEKGNGEIVEFIDDPIHTAPMMKIRYEDFSENVLIAPESIKIGDKIQEGHDAEVGLGNVLHLSSIPEGVPIYNIEVSPGDGGKLVRAAGGYATVVSRLNDVVSIRLPSKKTIELNGNCRAEIGVVAGGGAGMKPIMKAGKNFYIKHAVNANWPVHRGVKMNPVDHPFGGKQHHKGASSTVSRNAPPGAKVGHIAASRTGRRKRG